MYIMTQRQEVRFNVYNRTANIISTGVNMPYDIIDFNEGGGIYDTTTYQYTFSVAGTYVIGESHTKGLLNPAGGIDIKLIRNGQTIVLNRSQSAEPGYDARTIKSCLIYKFEENDILFCVSLTSPKMNNSPYTTNDIYNSFWGIRLDY